jgi:hypothetical protein
MTSETLIPVDVPALPFPRPADKAILTLSDVPETFRALDSAHEFVAIAGFTSVGMVHLATEQSSGRRALVVNSRWFLASRIDGVAADVLVGCLPTIGRPWEYLREEDREVIIAWVLWSWFRLEDGAVVAKETADDEPA